MNEITGICECGFEITINRQPEIPKNVKSLKWNWCPECEPTANCDWEEDFVYFEKKINIEDKNQLELFKK